MTLRCARCGRFVGEDALEGVDWSRGSIDPITGDWPYTGQYYCAPGVGCNRSRPVTILGKQLEAKLGRSHLSSLAKSLKIR